MRFKLFFTTPLLVLLSSIALTEGAAAKTLSEDFSDPSHCDFSTTTGVWNPVLKRAQAAIVAGVTQTANAQGDPTRVVSFGDGSLGSVATSSGYSFDTTNFPNGFNFRSLSITGGTITVTGNNPLIIRSLGAVTISSTVNITGGAGTDGAALVGATVAGGAGGTPIAGGGRGGTGGAVTANVAGAGTVGLSPTGANDASATGGAAGGTSGSSSTTNILFNADFDNLAGLFAGAGGGGGAFATNPPNHTGGGGGAGGGFLRISALGAATVATVLANGGAGGRDAGSTPCSGYGAPGNGGAFWVQSPTSVTAPNEPQIVAGTTPINCAGSPPTGQGGDARVDAPGLFTIPGGWTTVTPARYDLTNAAPSTTYVVDSKPYDLKTLNASFDGAPTVTQTLNGGTVTVTYAASKDGSTFTGFVSDPTPLSNQNYRYLKFRISIQTAAGTTLSPLVSQISVPYSDLGVSDLPVSFSVGCGTLKRIDGSPGGLKAGPNDSTNEKDQADSSLALIEFCLLLGFLLLTRIYSKNARYLRVALENRFDLNVFPAISRPPTKK